MLETHSRVRTVNSIDIMSGMILVVLSIATRLFRVDERASHGTHPGPEI